jgi:hypothetical protein
MSEHQHWPVDACSPPTIYHTTSLSELQVYATEHMGP